ncbi:16S rRNA (guanine(527)-N(7))-methyltransferase RsmG [Actinomyces lilanjuaniae]|uniref:Ribosomal RNA small subunit methyltransferase G n=1 Tax=Actinomyces lilanjuaniae TaxID=2321394 RepID=A0ABN5PUG0_9ACTO|nr:16S rRNA (guanine(527)-N(7))-methyltransferase RsmG [Actinomyces lilanjuaniae]AYD90681.1 16S rRNA (guanine(527)-N(7))-methyltransferase RsmG [Actinomyces lilanjuaniae]
MNAEVVDNEIEFPHEEVREFFGDAFSAAEHFANMLSRQGQLKGIIGPNELPRLWSRHLVNSAAVAPFLPNSGQVVDIGSGAGFPGVVIALLRPDLDVVLVDAMERRAQWLRDVVDELGLRRVTVRRERAEHIRERYDVVTARAVASLSKLIQLAAPLVRDDGCLIALKGDRVETEIKKARSDIDRFKLSIPVIHEVSLPGDRFARVVELRRVEYPINTR